MPGGNFSFNKYFLPLEILADEIRQGRGLSGKIKTNFMQGIDFSSGYIELPYSAKEEFEKLLKENIDLKDVTMEIKTKPTRVMTPRVKPATDDFDE